MSCFREFGDFAAHEDKVGDLACLGRTGSGRVGPGRREGRATRMDGVPLPAKIRIYFLLQNVKP